MARVHVVNPTRAHKNTFSAVQVSSSQAAAPLALVAGIARCGWLDLRSLNSMIEYLNREKLVISRQTLSAFPQTTLQNALDKLFRHVDKPCLHSQIVQTSPVDKLCRQTLSAKNPLETVDKLCLHFRCRQPLQRCVDEQECRRPRPEGRQSLSA